MTRGGLREGLRRSPLVTDRLPWVIRGLSKSRCVAGTMAGWEGQVVAPGENVQMERSLRPRTHLSKHVDVKIKEKWCDCRGVKSVRLCL